MYAHNHASNPEEVIYYLTEWPSLTILWEGIRSWHPITAEISGRVVTYDSNVGGGMRIHGRDPEHSRYN